MKRLLGVIIVFVVGWSAFWFMGASAVKTSYAQWFDDRQNEGWVAHYDDFALLGFPNRFDATFTGLELADPESGIAWTAPFFQLFTLSYRRNHMIAIWPKDQRIATPDAKYDILNEQMRASVVLGDDDTVDRANLEISAFSFLVDGKLHAQADAINTALLRQPDTPTEYRLAFNADGFAPAGILQQSRINTLPKSFETLQLDMTVRFDQEWAKSALSQGRPQPKRIKLRVAEAKWGEMRLRATGDLKISNKGILKGNVDLRVENWRDMLDLARESDDVSLGLIKTLEQGLTLVAGLNGNKKALDLPLRFADGRIYVGIIPVGKAPRLQIR